ncbi:MAG TPA: hypothetical protein VFU00_00485 [Gemmatimonadales bacterium]|nr:hypothetical protein [Gemmatimonadales bacterium]
MPRLSRWLARTALLHLVAALALGILMPAGAARSPWIAGAWPVYIHLLVLGWVTQLIAAVALWMFPRPDRRLTTEGFPGWAFYGLLNAGLVLRAIAEPLPALNRLLPIAALMHLGAILALAAMLWPRIRGR